MNKTAGLPKISINKGREWHIRRGHPWLFSGGISQAPKKVETGDLVTLLDCDGKFVGTGYYNPDCDIAVRVLSRVAGEEIDAKFLERKVASAWQLRERAIDRSATTVFRLLNAEGDFLPGFIVDYYDGVLVVQSHTAGADKLMESFLDALETVVKPRAIVLRNDASVRHREGLASEAPRLARGSFEGELVVRENNLAFAVDPLHGQKTGYFTDQRQKRLALAEFARRLPADARMLNCFSYTGSFSVYAAAANKNISTLNVDQSQPALDLAKRNFELNNLSLEKHEFECGDAFSILDSLMASYKRYEIVLLDPPAFAKSHKDKAKALKAYARMATLGLKVTADGGLLVLCSCSGAVSLDDFQESIRIGASALDRSIQIVDVFQHGPDHPLNAMATEGSYLKVVFCRVLD